MYAIHYFIEKGTIGESRELPRNCYVVDISLQNAKLGAEALQLAAEANFFAENPSLGKFRHWQLGLTYVPARCSAASTFLLV